MGRKSAAQIAQEEMEKAKAAEAAKQNEAGGDSGELVQEDGADTPETENNAASGDSGVVSGDSDDEDANQFAVEGEEEKKVYAVALRDLPGVGVKIGQIVLAPEKIIKSWDEVSWIDTHENALADAERAHNNKKIVDPRFNEPKVIELDSKGQIVQDAFEG
ncbi:hypothetical protein MARILYN_12 [Vibrio phage Marilyn]|nr:hypothetical protein MARILYN_12 [Vibrio phage Marilyn]WCD55535.1 hypothetical protein FAYDEN_12 [Vibrio phage Fayden]WCD55592.1 hypothetical protein BAYBAE_12 [Vibrio phage Baybae]WCD55651.1 hypothetical protein VAITEPHAGE_12 [Vibrio phage Vaitephage]